MTTETLIFTGELTVTRCWCGIGHAVPSGLYEWAHEDHSRAVFCPLGHQWVVKGETEAQRLSRQLQAARDQAAAESARADQVEASLRATKGHVTRLRRQVLAGECPFCGQHLRDLERHVLRQHPDETAEVPAAADAAGRES